MIDQQAPPLDGGHGDINHAPASIWMAFLRRNNSDKVYMNFKEVDFSVANIQSANLRFLFVRREMMTSGSQSAKMDVVQHYS